MNENNIIQFKRVLEHSGTLDEAVYNIHNRLVDDNGEKLTLLPGEPMLCSYLEDGATKYLLAIGIGGGNFTIIPAFNDTEAIYNFLNNSSGLDNISDDSDIEVTYDENGLAVLKVKDSLKNI